MNKPTLRQLRRSYRAHAGPRAFGPVGVQLTANDAGECSNGTAVLGGVNDLIACDTCGYQRCCCAVPCGRAEVDKPAHRACPHCSYVGNGDSHCPSCPTRKAAEAAEALAPGWRPADHGCVHACGAWVARVVKPGRDAWAWGRSWSGLCRSDDHVDSRDEAMARSLGWERENPSVWRGTGGKVISADSRRDDRWFAAEPKHASDRGREGSLPHAIAWCRGEAS
jgi:hypothetical protein